jgi:hypothetical protein
VLDGETPSGVRHRSKLKVEGDRPGAAGSLVDGDDQRLAHCRASRSTLAMSSRTCPSTVLRSSGAPILRAQVKAQVREMIANLERELASGEEPPA